MNIIPVLGLMSGTSMDGIDACILNTNGKDFERTGINLISPYSKQTRNMLKFYSNNNLLNNIYLRSLLDYLITKDHVKVVKKILYKQTVRPMLIGFHGQTVFHDPFTRTSLQLGNGQLLSNLTNIDVIYNFRLNDIENGGQGAPIAPIYHKALITKLNLSLPSCFINIGGIANITYWDGTTLLGFDTGPGNSLIDLYVQTYLNLEFDNNGDLANLGVSQSKIIKSLMNNKFFKLHPPKSLDKSFLNFILNDSEFLKLNKYDAIATLSELTAETIYFSIKQLPKKIKTIIISGGGQHNNFILKQLRLKIDAKIIIANDLNMPGDLIEAELISFLAARSHYNLPITFPSTTGVKEPMRGGILASPF